MSHQSYSGNESMDVTFALERPRLVRLCTTLVGSAEVAEDLAQETLLEAWLHLQDLRDPRRFQQLLTGIARNICLRWLRRQGRELARLVEIHDLAGEREQSLEDVLADDYDIEVELERKELIELLDRVSEKHGRKGQRNSYLSRLAQDLRFLGNQQVLLTLIFTVMITELLDAADSAVVMPVYVKQIFGNPLVLGLLWGVFGGIAFLGTIIFGAIGHRLPRRLTFSLCFMLLGLRFWSMAFYLPLWALIGIFALAGLAAGPLNPLILTVQQRLIPAETRARILSIVSTAYMVGTPLGGLLGGGLITWIGLTPSLFFMAVCYLLATGSLLVNPGLKSLDQ